MVKNRTKYDHDNDGMTSESDLSVAKKIQQIEHFGERAVVRKKMAITALASMMLFTFLLFLPIVEVKRIEVLSEMSGMFYITMAGIVAAYFGTTAWLSANK